MSTRSRRDEILANVSDLVAKFLYYDRQDDPDLPREAIEEAVAAGEITLDEIVAKFRDEVSKRVG